MALFSLTSSGVKLFFISRQELSAESCPPIKAHNARATWPIIALFRRAPQQQPYFLTSCVFIHIKDGGMDEGMRWRGGGDKTSLVWRRLRGGGVGDGSYHGNLVKALIMALKYHNQDRDRHRKTCQRVQDRARKSEEGREIDKQRLRYTLKNKGD